MGVSPLNIRKTRLPLSQKRVRRSSELPLDKNRLELATTLTHRSSPSSPLISTLLKTVEEKEPKTAASSDISINLVQVSILGDHAPGVGARALLATIQTLDADVFSQTLQDAACVSTFIKKEGIDVIMSAKPSLSASELSSVLSSLSEVSTKVSPTSLSLFVQQMSSLFTEQDTPDFVHFFSTLQAATAKLPPLLSEQLLQNLGRFYLSGRANMHGLNESIMIYSNYSQHLHELSPLLETLSKDALALTNRAGELLAGNAVVSDEIHKLRQRAGTHIRQMTATLNKDAFSQLFRGMLYHLFPDLDEDTTGGLTDWESFIYKKKVERDYREEESRSKRKLRFEEMRQALNNHHQI